jgi:uncharacterized protein DUF5996
MARSVGEERWPALPLADWQQSYASLHLRTQILGKTRLALSPMENHWWHTALYLTARGLTTSPMAQDGRILEVELDFVGHRLVASVSDGTVATLALGPHPLQDFYGDYLAMLDSLGFTPRIWPVPQESAGTVRFDVDDGHDVYDADAVHRCWRVLAQVDRVLKRFRGRFLGKCSPSHFWWGSFDIACTRFSGRRGPVHPGGIPNLSDRVTREAYSHECISAGWWPGAAGMLEEPAFYAYAYPEPAGCPEAKVRPSETRYDLTMREWILPYEVVRRADDPDAVLLEFLQSTYEAAATLAGWDRAALERGEPATAGISPATG